MRNICILGFNHPILDYKGTRVGIGVFPMHNDFPENPVSTTPPSQAFAHRSAPTKDGWDCCSDRKPDQPIMQLFQNTEVVQ